MRPKFKIFCRTNKDNEVIGYYVKVKPGFLKWYLVTKYGEIDRDTTSEKNLFDCILNSYLVKSVEEAEAVISMCVNKINAISVKDTLVKKL